MGYTAIIKQGRVIRGNNVAQPQPVHNACHVLCRATATRTAIGTAIRRAIGTERYRWPC